MNIVLGVAAAVVLAAGSPLAAAQDYPTKSIRVIVPLTPGSGADIAGRIVVRYMGDGLGKPLVVENRPGAGGQIGTQAVVKSDPDGYTLLVQSSSDAANPAIYKSLPYDPLKYLVDVALLGVTPYVMVTALDGPYKTIRALVDAAKAKPGAIRRICQSGIRAQAGRLVCRSRRSCGKSQQLLESQTAWQGKDFSLTPGRWSR